MCAEAKYRKVRLTNPTVKSALVDVDLALDAMRAMGWVEAEVEGEPHLALPDGVQLPSTRFVAAWSGIAVVLS